MPKALAVEALHEVRIAESHDYTAAMGEWVRARRERQLSHAAHPDELPKFETARVAVLRVY